MRVARALSALFLVATTFACSDDKTPASAPANDGGSSSSDGGGGTDGGGDGGGASGVPALNGCRSFVDRSSDDATRIIQWDSGLFGREERCMKVKVGQKVTFATSSAGTPADFNAHPLLASGGDTPNPFATAFDASTGEVSFATAGVFGFDCGVHSAGAMLGAILVD